MSENVIFMIFCCPMATRSSESRITDFEITAEQQKTAYQNNYGDNRTDIQRIKPIHIPTPSYDF